VDGGIEIKNKLVILLGIFLILALISGIGSAAEIIVQPGNSIQTAVNNASSGDTITLKAGTYTENLNITKGNLTIRSQSGNPDDTIIKAKRTTKDVLIVQASNVTIRGIKATGSGSSYSGIYLYKCSSCVIENSKAMNNGYGIRLGSSSKCTISKNTAMNNGVYGIYLGSSSKNTVSGNTANNDSRGIHVGSSDDNKLLGNTVTLNSAYGMYVCGLSDRNRIYNNYFNNTNMTIKNGVGNAYNTTKTSGKNIIGGSYMGGNFWGKPDGTGFSNKAVDKDGDGISDSAYTNITGSIYSDYLPLVTSSNPTAPKANFSSNVTSGNVPFNVLFTDTSTGSPTAWNWNFGDGGSATTQNPTHTYSTAGNYTVTLTVSNSAGNNTTTKSNYITAVTGTSSTKPVASFSSNVTSGNVPFNVLFTDTSTGSPTAWNWNFGDGGSSTQKNPTHNYSTAGNYTVTLTVSNTAGNNTTTKSNYITAVSTTGTKPVLNYWGSPRSGAAPLTVTFKDNSSGSPTAWNWSFGDGAYSTEKNPKHTYTAAGSYTISLTASNAAGSSTSTKSKYITVTGNTSVTPVSAFSASPTSGNSPLNVTFTDSSTGSPTSWSWSFGDGTSSTSQNPVHTYSAAGNYTVALTASNAAGSNTTTKSNYITVTGTSSQTPVAAFSASPTSGSAPMNVTFTESSTGTPTSWSWNFGDGNSSTEKSPVHTYSTTGNYTVTLTATNAAGSNTATKSNYITVTGTTVAKPVINCWGSPRTGTAPLTVYFKDSSSGSPTSWNWSFGDGTTSTLQNPKHVYSAAGSYTIKLTVTNVAGSTSVTKYKYIVVS
jgi:parallel beta-helix repeat protein